jgi:hypothetical protein
MDNLDFAEFNMIVSKLVDLEKLAEAFSKLGAFVRSETRIVFTRDTLADFDEVAKSYRKHQGVERTTVAYNSPAWICRGAHVRKGDSRRDIYVIDMGDVRAVVQM